MSFEGIPRPSQLNPYSDPLSPYIGAFGAAQDAARRPKIQSVEGKPLLDAIHEKYGAMEEPEDDEEKESLSEEEMEQIKVFAKLRGILNFSLKAGVRYKFHIDTASGVVQLVAEETGEVVLTLTPEELLQICGKLKRYAGMMADREG